MKHTLLRYGLVGLALVAVGRTGAAQPAGEATLYAGFIPSKGYVVGGSLTASGLIRRGEEGRWTHLGPNNPRVNALAYDPARPETLFVAAGNGVLRTFDGGRHWRIATDWRITEVQDVAYDVRAQGFVYAGTAYGIWRSPDYGDTWHEAADGIPQGMTYTETIEVDRTTAYRVLAGTDDGLYLSTDGARSWLRVGAPGVEVLDLQQSRTDPEVWLAGAYRHGLYLSTDGGRSWRPGPSEWAAHSFHGVAIDPFDARRMAAAGWDTGVLVSTDGGRTWIRRGRALPTDDFYEVAFDANVPGRILAATLEEGLFASDDLGETWSLQGLAGALIFDLAFVYPPETINPDKP